MPSPLYVLPLLRLPFGVVRGSAGPRLVGMGSRTRSAPGSRWGDVASAACSLATGLSAGSSAGRGARGTTLRGVCLSRCDGAGRGAAASDGSTNHGSGVPVECCGADGVVKMHRRLVLAVGEAAARRTHARMLCGLASIAFGASRGAGDDGGCRKKRVGAR